MTFSYILWGFGWLVVIKHTFYKFLVGVVCSFASDFHGSCEYVFVSNQSNFNSCLNFIKAGLHKGLTILKLPDVNSMNLLSKMSKSLFHTFNNI